MSSYLLRLAKRAASIPATQELTPSIRSWSNTKYQPIEGPFEAGDEPGFGGQSQATGRQSDAEFRQHRGEKLSPASVEQIKPSSSSLSETRFSDGSTQLSITSPADTSDPKGNLSPETSLSDPKSIIDPVYGKGKKKRDSAPEGHTYREQPELPGNVRFESQKHVQFERHNKDEGPSWAEDTDESSGLRDTKHRTALSVGRNVPFTDKALAGKEGQESEKITFRRFCHVDQRSADSITTKPSISHQGSKRHDEKDFVPELYPRQSVAPAMTPGTPKEPKLVIGRLSVEIVPSEPAIQPVQRRTTPKLMKPSADTDLGGHMKLRFGLGQI